MIFTYCLVDWVLEDTNQVFSIISASWNQWKISLFFSVFFPSHCLESIRKRVLKSIQYFHIIYLTKLKCQLVVLKSKLWTQFMFYFCVQELQILLTFKHYLPFFFHSCYEWPLQHGRHALCKMRPVYIIFLFSPSWYRVSLSSLFSTHEFLGSILAHNKFGVLVYACKPIYWEATSRKSEVDGHSWLHR